MKIGQEEGFFSDLIGEKWFQAQKETFLPILIGGKHSKSKEELFLLIVFLEKLVRVVFLFRRSVESKQKRTVFSSCSDHINTVNMFIFNKIHRVLYSTFCFLCSPCCAVTFHSVSGVLSRRWSVVVCWRNPSRERVSASHSRNFKSTFSLSWHVEFLHYHIKSLVWVFYVFILDVNRLHMVISCRLASWIRTKIGFQISDTYCFESSCLRGSLLWQFIW